MNSPCFLYTCLQCRNSEPSPVSASPSIEDKINNIAILLSSHTNIINELKSSISSSLSNNTVNNDNAKTCLENDNTITYANVTSRNISSSNAVVYNRDALNIPLFSSIIKQIDSSNLNTNYIKDLLKILNIDLNTISKVHFNNKVCIINFTTVFAKSEFLNLNSTIKTLDNKFNKLFIHDNLSADVRRNGNIFYHAIKSKLILNYKCTLNLKTNTYELRPYNDTNKLDWNCSPYLPSINELNTWSKSYDTYITSIKNKPNNKSN